jgi:hypothetical protein
MVRINFDYNPAEIEATEKANALAGEAAFRLAMKRRSLSPPEQIIADGKIHKCDVADLPNGNGRGSHLLHLDRLPAGGFANWRDDLRWQKWNAMMCDDAPSENHGGAS